MKLKISLLLFCLQTSALLLLGNGPPRITRFNADGRLSWQDGTTNGISVIEWSTNLVGGQWRPVFYDMATNAPRSAQLKLTNGPSGFYRINLQQHPQDEGLILHFPFDSDFANGMLLDASGHGNHGYRFGHVTGNTNWPRVTTGIDGGMAGLFNYYYDGWSLGRSGDYVAVTNLEPFMLMTNATVSVWIHYHAAPSGNYLEDGYATALSAGYATTGAWELGRNSSDATELDIFTNAISYSKIVWPDSSFQSVGNSGGWHHYAFTFNQGVVRAYFDGSFFNEQIFPVDHLTVSAYFLEVGGKTHNGDPYLEGGIDIYPNHGWLNGKIDDVRIYNRDLGSAGIAAIYHSFDRLPPSTPMNLTSRAASSSSIELRWDAAADRFGVAGYTVYKDNVPVVDVPGSMFLDTNVLPGATHAYQVEAFDAAGNRAARSPLFSVSAPPSGTPFEMILDDEDGLPWVTYVGSWVPDCCWLPGQWGQGWKNDDNRGKGTKSVTFRPSLPESSEYELFIRHVQRSSFSASTPVDVEYEGVLNTVFINQRTGAGTWKSLGRYPLLAGTNVVVRIRTQGTSGPVIADAIRITR